jgi:hypothetical protein
MGKERREHWRLDFSALTGLRVYSTSTVQPHVFR